MKTLLILAYAAAYKASGNKMFLDTAKETADYVFREMTGPGGEFYSAQDADSEGYRLLNNKTTYYVCKDHVCLPPTNDLPDLFLQ